MNRIRLVPVLEHDLDVIILVIGLDDTQDEILVLPAQDDVVGSDALTQRDGIRVFGIRGRT